MRFKTFFITEAAKGLKDLQFSGPSNNIPNFQVQIAERGMFVRLYMKTPKGEKFAGDLSARECFGETKFLPPYKLFAWHSDLNESLSGGFGPFLYDIAMEIATLQGGYLVSHALINRLFLRHIKDIDDDGVADSLDKDFYDRKGGDGGGEISKGHQQPLGHQPGAQQDLQSPQRRPGRFKPLVQHGSISLVHHWDPPQRPP